MQPLARTTTDGQVVVGDIPASRPGLQPRPALLAQLDRARRKPPVVLTGAWGAGKTQLAAAYARARMADNWRLIAWVNARDSDTMRAGLAAVAEAAGLAAGGSQPGDAGPDDAGQAIRRWLEADGSRRLLVFDDVADPSLLRPLIPAAGGALVLITVAREPAAEPGTELGTSVPVGVFSAEEAVALLDGRTGRADEAGASAVAAELGYQPLALDHAAGVIAGQHLDYPAYLAKLRALPAGDDLVRGEDGAEPPAPPGVPEAVLLSLEAAAAADPLGVSAGVIEFTAVLSPAAAGRGLLYAAGSAGTLLGGGRRVAAPMVDQALKRLSEQALLSIRLDGRAAGMHGLVARVARGWLARRGRLGTACRTAAAALEGSAAARAEQPDHAAVREWLGQVTALLEHADAAAGDAGEKDEKLAAMLTRLRGLALHHLVELGGSTARAIAIGEPLTADLERQPGPGDPDTVRALGDLARAYREAGRVADAVPLVERTLAAREREFGADHPSTLASRNNLASAYRATGRPAEAIPLFEQNVAACERLLGADHPRTRASRHHLELARQEAAQAAGEGP